MNVKHEFDARYEAPFRSIQALRPPRLTRAIGALILAMLGLLALMLTLTPWIQTAPGSGQLIALNPVDRVQSVTALTGGRIKAWHVRDGSIIQRLQAELDAVRSRVDASRIATETALIDVERKERLFKKGLAARRDVEAARIKYKELRGYQASAAADLAKAETAVSRQATQLITAPRDGMILRTANADTSTYIKEGDVLVTFAPQSVSRAVEIYVSGLDAVLVRPGRQVRLMFEGWPAVQFSGWPSVAVGTFAGVVQYVDPAVSINGRYRIVVVEPPGEPWPGDHYLRLGGKVRGWVLLNEVRLGYEIWRQLNYFPPEPTVAADPRGGSGEASSK
jgi:multidrug efflux pump subunit AcrA (membrane-fusion protein)